MWVIGSVGFLDRIPPSSQFSKVIKNTLSLMSPVSAFWSLKKKSGVSRFYSPSHIYYQVLWFHRLCPVISPRITWDFPALFGSELEANYMLVMHGSPILWLFAFCVGKLSRFVFKMPQLSLVWWNPGKLYSILKILSYHWTVLDIRPMYTLKGPVLAQDTLRPSHWPKKVYLPQRGKGQE